MKNSVVSVRSVVNLKDTELGPLPEEWQVVRLGEVMTPVTRNSRRISVQDNQTYTLLSVGLYAHGVRVKESVFGKQLKTKVWYRAERGDFLLLKIWARKGSYGFFQADVLNPIVSGDYPILRLDETRANPDFVGLYLSQPFVWDRLGAGAKGATNRQRVHERQFLSLTTIPLPPLAEQRAIAHVLRTVQEAKQATERVIAALRELKKSLMRHLFTYGVAGFTTENTEKLSVNSVRSVVNLKDTELGPIPAHWQVVRLGEVTEMKQGKVLPTKKMRIGGYPVFGANGQIGWFSEYTHDQSEVLVTCRGATCGAVNVSPPKSFITNNAMVVSPKMIENLDKGFLSFALRYVDLKRAVTGTGQPQITKATLSTCPIPLPPLPEQREIARILQAVDRRIQAEEAYARALGDLFQSLLHELMSGRRRVQFTTENTEGTEKR